MANIKKIFVEKKENFNVEAKKIQDDLARNLKIKNLTKVRVINEYIIFDIDEKTFEKSLTTVFSEPPVDSVYIEKFPKKANETFFGIQLLPGQYDQRADSATQCLKLINPKTNARVVFTRVIVLEGKISISDINKTKKYLINPVESYESDINSEKQIEIKETPQKTEKFENFLTLNKNGLTKFHQENKLAMSLDDIEFVQKHFLKIKRTPTVAEIKVIDTYWSDHCRHTTFESRIQAVKIEPGKFSNPIKKSYEAYFKMRQDLFGSGTSRKMCLMDIATICAKEMNKKGLLSDLDLSDEINACSLNVDVDVNGKTEKYILMFKNETHNHPTEIEPFGGASTCLGGAIRDPLSGRTYVYQAMRVTGSGDPTQPISKTLPNKLPQKTITKTAADGYAAYGNQIGVATGQVDEIYHPGYIAKRMEVGAVIACAPKANVVRGKIKTGDIILLVGGETGRDGVGGATGSSKKHSKKSSVECGAEVQKGNAVCERKIQRLFKRAEVAKIIKKCNDFGAGGISVAVGELAPGVDIQLDKVTLKYPNLSVTEIAISESQERMAVVISKGNEKRFIKFARDENLCATKIATVTKNNHLRMMWNKEIVVDLDRAFLDTNGVEQKAKITIKNPKEIQKQKAKTNIASEWKKMLLDLNCCSKLGLVQKFDSTIGADTVLMPLGGKCQMTPAEGMAAKLQTFGKETNTVSLMSYGFNPYIGEWSPYHMGYYSVIESITKIIAMGGELKNIRFSFQEYFEKLESDPIKWGKPFAALLGAFEVQSKLDLAAIGGKDSMSGTYEKISVPPTLISFAVAVGNAKKIISPEFKKTGSTIYLVSQKKNEDGTIDLKHFKNSMNTIHDLIASQKIISAFSLKHKGVAEAIYKMSLGNKIGFEAMENFDCELFEQNYGSLVIEVSKGSEKALDSKKLLTKKIGKTIANKKIIIGKFKIDLDEMEKIALTKLGDVFRYSKNAEKSRLDLETYKTKEKNCSKKYVKKPVVVIPVLPGTNCEFDSQNAWEKAGATVKQVLIRNLDHKMLEESIKELAKAIRRANIIMIPGGFSGGDEPDGSAKFIVNVFQNPNVKKSTTNLLQKRDGLIIGICNGFQALIKLGLVPYGEIKQIDEAMPTLTYNSINHHMSCLIHTKVISNKSPWFYGTKINDIYTLPVSHGEGRFVASDSLIKYLSGNGQIATQYVDLNGKPTMETPFNPNGSTYAIEAITSPDGRVLGKMAHSERIGTNLYKNVLGVFDQKLFENGVKYFHRGK